MQKIRNSWTVRHFQLVIILGLSVGILFSSFDILSYLPQAEAITYTKEVPACLGIDCEIIERSARIFEENKEMYMEQARLDALTEINDVLLDKMDESPYVDYHDMEQKFGY